MRNAKLSLLFSAWLWAGQVWAAPDAPVLTLAAQSYGAPWVLSWPPIASSPNSLGSVRIETDQGAGFTLKAVVPAWQSSFNLAVPCGITLSVRAQAVDTLGNTGTYSAVTQAAAPCAPLIAPGTVTNSALSLGWSPAPGALPVDSWVLRYENAPNGTDPLSNLEALYPAGQLTGLASAVPAGQSRYYRIYAVYAGVTSAGSSQAAVLPPPSSLTAIPSRGAVYLAWTSVLNGLNPSVTGYTVYRASYSPMMVPDPLVTAQSVPGAGAGLPVAVTISGLSDHQLYYFSVESNGGTGGGAQSAVLSATPRLATPMISSLLQVQGGPVQVQWSAVNVSPNLPAAYALNRAADAALATVSSITVTTGLQFLSGTAAAAGTPSWWYLTLTDSAGAYSDLSPTALAIAAPSLDSPLLSVVDVRNTRVSLSWTAVAGATEYEIQRATFALSLTFTATVWVTGLNGITSANSYVDVEPTNGQGNLYRVLARAKLALAGSYVESAYSECVTATPYVLPGMPGRYYDAAGNAQSYLTVTPDVLPGQPVGMTLSWARAELGSYNLSGYNIFRGPSLSSLSLISFTAATSVTYTVTALSTYADTGLYIGQTLAYAVQALDVSGSVGVAVSRVATVSAFAAPGAPLSLLAQTGPAGVTLSWVTPSAGTYGISAYAIWRRSPPAGLAVLLTSTTRLNYVDSAPNTALSSTPLYVAQALDRFNLGGLSATSGVSLPAAIFVGTAPSAVAGFSAAGGVSGAAHLSWNAAQEQEQVSHYALYRDGAQLITTSAASYVDPSLGFGNAFTWQVQAVNAVGAGVSTTSGAVTLYPPAPSGLAIAADISGNTNMAVRLTWNDLGTPGGVTQYVVFRATGAFTGPTVSYVPITWTAGSAFSDELFVQGVRNVYRVLSWAQGQTSTAHAAEAYDDIPASFGAPIGLTSNAAWGGAVSLTWTPASWEQESWVYRSTSGPLGTYPLLTDRIAVLPATTDAYLDSGAAAGTTYYYAVAGASHLGRDQAVNRTVLPAPGKATSLTATAGYNGGAVALIAWTAPSGLQSAVSYAVYRSLGGGSPWPSGTFLGTTTNATYMDPIPLTNTAYSYQVVSQNGVDGPVSTAVTVRAFDLPVPPSGLSASGVNGAVSVTWQPVEPGTFSVILDVQAQPSPMTITVPAGVQTAWVGPVTNGTLVTITAVTVNSAGTSLASLPVYAEANAGGPALSPLSFSARAGEFEASSATARVFLNWTVSVSGTQQAVIYRSTAPMTLSDASGGAASPLWLTSVAGVFSSLTDSAVAPGGTYYYGLSALSALGLPGGESPAVLAGAVTPFSYPAFSTLTAQAGYSQVDLQWQAPVFAGTAGLASVPYKLYRKQYVGTVPAFTTIVPDSGFPVSLTSTSYLDQAVSNGSTYAYFLTVVDSAGREQPKAASAAGIRPLGPRRPPQTLRFIPGDETVTIQWVVTQADALEGVHYNVYRKTTLTAADAYAGPLPHLSDVGPSSSQFVGVSLVVQTLYDRDFGFSGLENKTTYCYALAPLNDFGEGSKSLEFCVTPFKALDPGKTDLSNRDLSLSIINRKDVRLTWGACPTQSADGGYDVLRYDVYRSKDGGNNYDLLSQLLSTTATAYAYVDASTEFGSGYVYRVVPVDTAGNDGISYRLANVIIPGNVTNLLIFRNAFNPAIGEKVGVQYLVQQPGRVWVKVYTLQGEYVATLFDEQVGAASPENPYLSQRVDWDGLNFGGQTVASGVYLLHLESPAFRVDGRVAVIK